MDLCSDQNMTNPFDKFPDEVIENILGFLDIKTLTKCRQVSYRWIDIIDGSPKLKKK